MTGFLLFQKKKLVEIYDILLVPSSSQDQSIRCYKKRGIILSLFSVAHIFFLFPPFFPLFLECYTLVYETALSMFYERNVI